MGPFRRHAADSVTSLKQASRGPVCCGVVAAAGSCGGSVGELRNRALVSAVPLSPFGEERPAEPRDPGWWALPGAGGGVGPAGLVDTLFVPWGNMGPITSQSLSRRTLVTSAFPALSAQSAGSGRLRPVRG